MPSFGCGGGGVALLVVLGVVVQVVDMGVVVVVGSAVDTTAGMVYMN